MLELRLIIHGDELEIERLQAKVALLAMQRDYWQERCAERTMLREDLVRARVLGTNTTAPGVDDSPAAAGSQTHRSPVR